MAEQVKDFDAEYDLPSKVGLTFKLGGYEFHTKGYGPPSAYLTDERGLRNAVTFIRAVLLPEDRDVFDKMLLDPDAQMSGPQLDQVAVWLIEVTSATPTESPDSSGSGVGRTSSGSKEN